MSPTAELKPYSIWWRRSCTAQWVKITDLDEHPGDLGEYVKTWDWAWAGQWRLVSQRVIEERHLEP